MLLTSSGHSNVHDVHQLFDGENYEIKSCLSADLEQHEKASCRFYALVIDAGSTGTRLHAFEFRWGDEKKRETFRLATRTVVLMWLALEVLFVSKLFVVYTFVIFKAVGMKSVVSWCLSTKNDEIWSTIDREIGKRRWKMLKTEAEKQRNFQR